MTFLYYKICIEIIIFVIFNYLSLFSINGYILYRESYLLNYENSKECTERLTFEIKYKLSYIKI